MLLMAPAAAPLAALHTTSNVAHQKLFVVRCSIGIEKNIPRVLITTHKSLFDFCLQAGDGATSCWCICLALAEVQLLGEKYYCYARLGIYEKRR